MMLKPTLNNLYLFFVLFVCGNLCAQSITGPTEVTAGIPYTYTFMDDALFASPYWSASPGSIGTTSLTGLTYRAKVNWSAGGSGTLTFMDGSTVLAILYVTITGPPSAPTIYGGSSCGPGTVTLTGTSGSGGDDVHWFSTSVAPGGYLGAGSYFGVSVSTTTTYYAASYSSSSGLYSSPRVAVNAIVNALPTVYSITGGGGFCSGGSGVTVGLSGSQAGVNYQVRIQGNDYGAAVAGTGGALTWYNQTTNGTYTIVATDASSGCSAMMSGSTSVIMNPNPSAYTMTGGGSFCSDVNGVSVGLNGSLSGINYQLQINGSNSGAAVAGTGSALTWANQTTGGSYTVLATNASTGCYSTMSGNATVTVNAAPAVYTVSGGGTFCSGSSANVSLSGSQSGVNYQLKINGINSGSAIAGTGSVLTWASQTTAGSYTVQAINASSACTTTMSGSATVTVNAMPSVYTLSGGGTFCTAGGSVSVTLSSSQTGVNYQLKLNGVNNGTVKAGNNGALTWTSLTAAGAYTIVGTNVTTGCAQIMSGSATATANAASVGGSISPTAISYFFSSPSAALTLSGHTGTVQRWEYNAGGGWLTVTPNNTTTSLSYSNVTVTTSYRAFVKSGVCSEVVSATATITIQAKPVITSSQQYIPYGGSTTLSTSVYNSYVWKKNGVAISGATAQTYVANEPANYTVDVTLSGVTGTGVSNALTINSVMSATQVNLHSVTNILQAGVTNSTNVYSLPADKISQTIDYQDGYGRTYQVVGVGQSPNSMDVVIPAGYSVQGLVEKSYLPYVAATKDGLQKPNAIRGSDFQYNTSDQYQFYQTTPLVANDQYPYAVKVLASSPLADLREQGAPGADWQPGSGHTIKNDLILNVASQVRYWLPAGTTSSYYAANLLVVSQVTDENGNKVRTFTDKLGQTILKQVQLDETLEGVVTPWLETYYIYDEYNRLKYILPPKALKVLGTGGTLDANSASVTELIHKFTYDTRGRLVEKKVPSAALQYIVYDNLDRVVLTQDGNLRATNKWNFVKYDAFNRPVYSGLYTNNTQTTRAAVQGILDPINYDVTPYYESEGTAVHGYTNVVFPITGSVSNDILSVNYYDHYDFDRNTTADYSYDASHLSGQDATASTRTRLLPTGSKRVTFDAAGAITGNWLINVVFYDQFDRPIQTRSNNHLYATVADKTTIIYDFAGKVTKSKTTHYQNASTSVYFVDRPVYDHAGRVLQAYRQINSDPEKLLVQYVYNKLGQVVDKKLHNISGNTFLQSVDYRYSIRGWLKSINNAQLTNDSGATNDDIDDYFGMELAYNTVESGLSNTQYYNGNISATKWKGPGTTGAADQRSYKYTYDKSDRLKTATFQAHTGTAWTKEANTLNESMTYDHNGNIKTLTRNRNLRGNSGITITSTPETFDNLTYTYANNLDKLTKVEDAVTGTVGQSGFNNQVNTTTEYLYNTDGALNKDDNKGITGITYNVLGKPQVITFSGSPTKTIQYVYDATGTKLKMITTIGGVITTTDYVGGFVYENSALSFFSSPEGRVVKNGANYEYQYAIGDHQGNTRVLFTSATPTPVAVTTTMEATSDSNFLNYSNRVGFNLMDHTDAGTTYQYAQKLTGGYNAQVGVARSYKVYPGDKVKIDAWGKFTNVTSNGSNVANFASALLAAFGVAAPVGGDPGSISTALNTWGGLVGGGSGGTNPGAPKAFVNIVVFDKNYKLLDAAWDGISATAEQVGATPVVAHDLMSREYTIKEEGYVYMYVSNENPTIVDVYFDDITMTHTKGNVIQYNEYYAFGLQTANSWTRENTTGNNFLGNGGTELNTTSNLYDLHFRNYDPILGRMNQVDPMATKYASLTPYNFAFNDPVYYNDRLGDSPTHQSWQDIEDSRKTDIDRNYYHSHGVLGDDDMYGRLFGREGIGSGNGSIAHQGYEAAHIKARETGGKVSYSAGEYWAEVQIEEFVVDPLYTGFAPGVMAFKKSGQKQTQGGQQEERYPLDLTTATFSDIMKAFRYARQVQGSHYFQDIFEFKSNLKRSAGLYGTIHTKNYKGIQIVFQVYNSSARTLIDQVQPFYKGQPNGKQKGWYIDENKVNTKGLNGPIDYPYSIAIFAGGLDSESNERSATVFFSDLDTFKRWKKFVSGE
jgi:RHS repeat-associated protein